MAASRCDAMYPPVVSVLDLSPNAEWVNDCLQLLGLEHESNLDRVRAELTSILQRQCQATHSRQSAPQPVMRSTTDD